MNNNCESKSITEDHVLDVSKDADFLEECKSLLINYMTVDVELCKKRIQFFENHFSLERANRKIDQKYNDIISVELDRMIESGKNKNKILSFLLPSKSFNSYINKKYGYKSQKFKEEIKYLSSIGPSYRKNIYEAYEQDCKLSELVNAKEFAWDWINYFNYFKYKYISINSIIHPKNCFDTTIPGFLFWEVDLCVVKQCKDLLDVIDKTGSCDVKYPAYIKLKELVKEQLKIIETVRTYDPI